MRTGFRAGLCALLLGLLLAAAPAEAAYSLPLSQARLGAVCATKPNTEQAVACWLQQHPDVANAMIFYDSTGGGPWSRWKPQRRTQFFAYFNQMVKWYNAGAVGGQYPSPFDFPIQPEPLPPAPGLGYMYRDSLGRVVYLSLVANNLAAELTAAFPWSIANYAPAELTLLLNMGNVFANYVDSQGTPAGFYFVGDTHTSPATAGYVVAFLKKSHVLAGNQAATIARLVEWSSRLRHYWFDEGDPNRTNFYAVAEYFWGPNSPPIPASTIIRGTTYGGPSGPTKGRFTRGCSGTGEFMKSVLQAVNIPVKVRFLNCQHVVPVFPTAGLALTHGDDPYDWAGRVTPFPGFPTPEPEERLISIADLATLFPAGQSLEACEQKTGLQPIILGINYLSDMLMTLYCQDRAAVTSRAAGLIMKYLSPHWPELTPAEVQQMLEQTLLWDRLELKVTATNFCGGQ
jgi:hypothetical protein